MNNGHLTATWQHLNRRCKTEESNHARKTCSTTLQVFHCPGKQIFFASVSLLYYLSLWWWSCAKLCATFKQICNLVWENKQQVLNKTWKNWDLAGYVFFLEAKIGLENWFSASQCKNINACLCGDEKWGVKKRNNKEKRKTEGYLKDESYRPPHSNHCHVFDGERGHPPPSPALSPLSSL